MSKAQIDEDGQLDNSYQDQRQGNTFFYQSNDHEDRYDRDGIYNFEVLVGGLDQILGTGSFTDQHALGIVFFQNSIQLIDLGIYLIGSGLIFGVHQKEFPVITL